MTQWLRCATGMTALLVISASAMAASVEGARWRVTDAGAEETGLRLLDGGDGLTEFISRGGARCLVNKAGADPSNMYMYFGIEDNRAFSSDAPVYVVAEYFDGGLSGRIRVNYDSTLGEGTMAAYRESDEQWGGWMTGREEWCTAIFKLSRPSFKNRQNLGADFRFVGKSLAIRSVSLTLTLPKNAAAIDKLEAPELPQKVMIGSGGQLIIGGFDPARKADVRNQTRALEAHLPTLKALGVTSHEGYVRWNLCEPSPGQYDWSVYDAYVAIYRKYNIKWVPFLIIGSAYSLPDWYYKKEGSQGYVCLEHGETCDVESLWNPVLRGHVARFIKAFCEHYRDSGVIESILLGITGNYGEAIYVASGNDWTADIHGQYHTHSGFWAGDPHAKRSLRASLKTKYKEIAKLNSAWGTSYADFGDVNPFLRDDAPSDRAWLDFCNWYIGSMNEWAAFWMSETRRHFPDGEIYLCTGGHAPPEHGANFAVQCKIAAMVGGGVRITNEASDLRANFSLTRWVASGGRQYGAPYQFEPAGMVDANGVIARVYNATASGAKGLHYYYPNLLDTDAARENFVKWGSEFKQRTPITEIAVYYPQTYIKLKGKNDFLGKLQPLRDYFDFGYLSDDQIFDGGLDQVKALFVLDGNVSEAPVWRAIRDWVQAGGVLVYPAELGRLRTVEGDESYHDALFGPGSNLGKGRAALFPGKPDGSEYRRFLTKHLAEAPELSPGTRAMVKLDGKEDGVFVSFCAPNELLWLNYTGTETEKQGEPLPPYSIVSQRVPSTEPSL